MCFQPHTRCTRVRGVNSVEDCHWRFGEWLRKLSDICADINGRYKPSATGAKMHLRGMAEVPRRGRDPELSKLTTHINVGDRTPIRCATTSGACNPGEWRLVAVRTSFARRLVRNEKVARLPGRQPSRRMQQSLFLSENALSQQMSLVLPSTFLCSPSGQANDLRAIRDESCR
jgi:hypothetical protein